MPQSIHPNSKPQMTKADAEQLLSKYDVLPYTVKLLGIRGYYKQTMGNPLKNDIGIYDDAIMIVAPDHFSSYNANTDPSWSNPGIATLKPGVHLYKKGKHGITRSHPYDALRPATAGEKLPVTRDGKDSVGIAINIHKGSTFSTSSEGCQTIYPEQWSDFITTVYMLLSRHKQSVVPYVLVEL